MRLLLLVFLLSGCNVGLQARVEEQCSCRGGIKRLQILSALGVAFFTCKNGYADSITRDDVILPKCGE